MQQFDYLVYVGRFQPFHKGHLEVLRRALAKARTVIVVLGSARRARNIKNPFLDDERQKMITAAVEDMNAGDVGRIVFCPVRDYYDNDKWVAAVRNAVRSVTGPHARVGIIGHHKDHSSYYLHEFPDWSLVHEQNCAGLCATDIRGKLFAQRDSLDSEELATDVPEAVLRFLREFRQSPPFADLAEEFSAVQTYKLAWAAAPYPPIFVTVDAVVRCNDKVLFIKRGNHPGRGQWALPGGFVEQNEALRDGAIRELLEETGLPVGSDVLRNSIVDAAVFDHPDRSVRGRTITHGFLFDINTQECPSLIAADDAAEARWIPVSSLSDVETMVFEDHLHIVDRFLGVL